MDSLQKQLNDLKEDLKVMRQLVQELRDGQERFAGGYTLLGTIVAVAASLGAAISWAVAHITYTN
jgi:hypothetical protein